MHNKILFSLALIALFIAPGFTSNQFLNRLLACTALLLLVSPKAFHKPNVAQWMAILWIGWSIFCSFYSEHPAQSFYGFHLRWEGAITLMLFIVLGVYASSVGKDLSDIRWAVAGTMVILLLSLLVRHYPNYSNIFLSPIALAGLVAVGSIYLVSWHPLWLVAVLPLLIFSQNRTGLITAFIGIGLFYVLTRRFRTIHVAVTILALIIGAIGFRERLAAINPSVLGIGSRAQWIMQAEDHAKALPLTGFGPDVLGHYLNRSTGNSVDKVRFYDKTHNILFDTILQTGWIGYTLAALTFGATIAVVIHHPTPQNIACLCVIITWITFGFLNPQGVPAHTLALLAIFKLRCSS